MAAINRIARGGAPSIVIPTMVIAGAVYGATTYVKTQLQKESATMNRMFAQKNSPQAEASRRERLLLESETDPRRTIYNVLSW